MALGAATHCQSRVHVEVVAGKVQADKTLKDNAPSWECACQKYQQTRRRTTIGDHVQHGPKSRRLFKLPRCRAVQSVEEAGNAVKEGACTRVKRHVVEGSYGENNA